MVADLKKTAKPELLAPAGDFLKLQTAFSYGADAVYVGGSDFSLRAKAGNFDLEQLAEAVAYSHKLGKKIYITVNIFAHNEDIDGLSLFLEKLAQLAPDALIISDLGVMALAQEIAPNLDIHISTQANIVNYKAAQAWAKLGAKRLILGRELALPALAEISQRAGIGTEIFVHGAMCMSYSGRCLLSNFLTARDANRGDCSQSCRWQYVLSEEKRPGEFFPLDEDARGSYIFNSKDLCLINYLPQIIAAGIQSLKIEGRNKSAYYVANTVRIYRQALDAAFAAPDAYQVNPLWQEELAKISHREYTEGFINGPIDYDDHRYDNPNPIRGYDFVAIVRQIEQSTLIIEQRNHIACNDDLELLLADKILPIKVNALADLQGQPLQVANKPKQIVRLSCDTQNLSLAASLPLIIRRRMR